MIVSPLIQCLRSNQGYRAKPRRYRICNSCKSFSKHFLQWVIRKLIRNKLSKKSWIINSFKQSSTTRIEHHLHRAMVIINLEGPKANLMIIKSYHQKTRVRLKIGHLRIIRISVRSIKVRLSFWRRLKPSKMRTHC